MSPLGTPGTDCGTGNQRDLAIKQSLIHGLFTFYRVWVAYFVFCFVCCLGPLFGYFVTLCSWVITWATYTSLCLLSLTYVRAVLGALARTARVQQRTAASGPSAVPRLNNDVNPTK